MKNIIFFKTTADFNNTGEVLIYKSLLNFIRKYGSVIVNDGMDIQPKFLRRIGIRDEERLSSHTKRGFIFFMLQVAMKAVCTCRNVYFVTGVGEHSIDGIKSIVKNIVSFVFLFVMRLLGAKIVRIGMSMRFGGKAEALSECLLSVAVNHYYVRDSISFNNCLQGG